MIAVSSVARILKGLSDTKGKSGTQIDIERELKALIEKRGIASLTEAELEALFEEAAMECAMRDVTAKMRKEGKIPDVTSQSLAAERRIMGMAVSTVEGMIAINKTAH